MGFYNPPASGSGAITIGTTTITGGTNTRVLFDNSGVVGEYAITGTGSVVMSASPSLSGTLSFPDGSTWSSVGAVVASASTFLPGTTNTQDFGSGSAQWRTLFAQNVNNQVGVLGLESGGTIYAAIGNGATGGVAVASNGVFAWGSTTAASTIDTGLSRDSAGVIDFGSGAQGSTAGAWKATNGTLSGTLTYGGVTLSSSVTGTGSMVLSASPSFSGTTAFASQTSTGTGTFQTSVASSAGGTGTAAILFSSTASFGILFGATGSAAPSQAAAAGCLFINTTGSNTASRMYIRTSAAAWTTFTTAA